MGVSNFFYQGKEVVKNFVHAVLSPEKKKAGENPNPKFEELPDNKKINLK